MDNYNLDNPLVTRPESEEYLYAEEGMYDTGYDAGYDASPDTKDIKEVVGQAISGIPGVLGLKGKLSDIFKKDEDLTRGISARKAGDGRVSVSARVIADSGYNSGMLIDDMTEAITYALQAQLGLVADKIEIDIAETMTEAEFYDKYDADRALH